MARANDCAVQMLDGMKTWSRAACSVGAVCRKQNLWETIYTN